MKVFFEMHECARQLDETLEKIVIARSAPKPEMFKDIMGLVVFRPVEADEETDVAGIVLGESIGRNEIKVRSQWVERFEKGVHPFGFESRLLHAAE